MAEKFEEFFKEFEVKLEDILSKSTLSLKKDLVSLFESITIKASTDEIKKDILSKSIMKEIENRIREKYDEKVNVLAKEIKDALKVKSEETDKFRENNTSNTDEPLFNFIVNVNLDTSIFSGREKSKGIAPTSKEELAKFLMSLEEDLINSEELRNFIKDDLGIELDTLLVELNIDKKIIKYQKEEDIIKHDTVKESDSSDRGQTVEISRDDLTIYQESQEKLGHFKEKEQNIDKEEDSSKEPVSKENNQSKSLSSFPSKDMPELTPLSIADVYISHSAFKMIMEHCGKMGKKNLEALGFLMGHRFSCEGGTYIDIEHVVTSDLDASSVSVKFKDFGPMFKDLYKFEKEGKDYILLGWYHSHPGHTCFLSETDIETQKRMFKKDYQIALVVDPIHHDMKIYRLDAYDQYVEISYSIYS